MATANELFAANGEDYIVIDSDLRTMTFPASVNNIGVENDKDVHKLNFKMPRYFSGYDLSEFIIHINYVNANGDADMYYVLDPTVEENEIIFSWLVGRHACLYRGSVTFIVCLKLADGEGDVAQEFNTTLASLQVLPGLETEPTILETEHDVIEQLLLSINDTNAKIKAVLDTGLTPEQIAEFYNKSKIYDTEITALNSKTALAWHAARGNQVKTDIQAYLEGLAASGLNGFHVFWNTSADSDTVGAPITSSCYYAAHILNSEAIHIVCYVMGKAKSDIYTKQKFANSWGEWIELPTRGEVDALNSRLGSSSNLIVDFEDDSFFKSKYTTPNSFIILPFATAAANQPVSPATFGYCEVYYGGNSGTFMIMYINSKNKVYFRSYASGRWYDWEAAPTRSEIDELNSRYVIDYVKSDSVTLAAGARQVIKIDCVKSGYSAVGILGIYVADTDIFSVNEFYISSVSTLDVVAQNQYTEARTSVFRVTVLFEKNS